MSTPLTLRSPFYQKDTGVSTTGHPDPTFRETDRDVGGGGLGGSV